MHKSWDQTSPWAVTTSSDGTIHRIVSNIAILTAYHIVSYIVIIPSETI